MKSRIMCLLKQVIKPGFEYRKNKTVKTVGLGKRSTRVTLGSIRPWIQDWTVDVLLRLEATGTAGQYT